ncbi:beta-arabinofuranosyltransferase RAY1 [Aristolochia californica]|uniref:beta-arabinofuranosyltransferase RAY1 n=1 Tax=Aristolochia californica TaxID=171875 RepID=UPI0035DB083A
MKRVSPFAFRKASQVGLWSVWLSGLLLILLSLYSTRQLPSLKGNIERPVFMNRTVSAGPSVTIFSAPRAFQGETGSRQFLAIKSWLALSPDIDVVLFARDPSIVSFAGRFGKRVFVESDIDFTFLGTPFFHSMVARSRACDSNISILIHPETILFSDFLSTLKYAHNLTYDWLLIAKSQNISHFPFHLDDSGKHWLHEDGRKIKTKKLQGFLNEKRQWSSCGPGLLLAWNTGELPLHAGVLPPFLYRRGFHDLWVVNEALSSGFRFVFDASDVISSYYPEKLGYWANQMSTIKEVRESGERNWEYAANSNHAMLYGSLNFQGTNFTNNLVKLADCSGQYLFVNTAEGVIYDIQEQRKERFGLWKRSILQVRREKKWTTCIEDSKLLNKQMHSSIKELPNTKRSLHFPFSLESLLQIVADRDKSVVLAVAGNNYRDMLMSWVCRLHHLSISNFVVCALDADMYQFSLLQGLPVFMDQLAPNTISFNDCHFGTECFQKVTKVKSRIVLKILKLGYNVLLSDVDVYWFQNPLPYLYSFGPSVLVVQSDEYKETVPINLPRRLNSGFYFARSDGPTIFAMAKVVKHAAKSDLSEQPSFYDVLCGGGGTHRIGDDRCLEPETNLTVHFLNRNRFPNGAYQGLWEKKNVREACTKRGCVILHNNWVSGRKKKLERQVSSGLWEYDPSSRLCRKGWFGNHSNSHF